MSNHTTRFKRDLESFGFRRDDNVLVGHGGVAYTHPNAPDDPIRVFPQNSDNAIATISKKAKKIAGLSTNGTNVTSVKERARITQAKKKSKRQKEDDARDARAAEAEREYESEQREFAAGARRREIESLMQPGRGK